MDWQPIETYDALPDRRKMKIRAVFFFKATKRLPYRTDFLCAGVSIDPVKGNREITHWVQLPADPVDAALVELPK